MNTHIPGSVLCWTHPFPGGCRVPMLLLLKRRIQKWWSRAPWATLSALIVTLYVAGYIMMRCTEPASNPIRSLPTYTYFFLVTVTTVGYGDVVPVSTAGRLVAGAIPVGGLGDRAPPPPGTGRP